MCTRYPTKVYTETNPTRSLQNPHAVCAHQAWGLRFKQIQFGLIL